MTQRVRHRTDSRFVRNASFSMMPDYMIWHDEGLPDEVLADNYAEQDGDLVFTRDGEEVFRLPMAVVVSVAPKDES